MKKESLILVAFLSVMAFKTAFAQSANATAATTISSNENANASAASNMSTARKAGNTTVADKGINNSSNMLQAAKDSTGQRLPVKANAVKTAPTDAVTMSTRPGGRREIVKQQASPQNTGIKNNGSPQDKK